MPNPVAMVDARAGNWTAGRPVATLRWMSRLRGAELPNELAALILIAAVACGGLLLVAAVPLDDRGPVGLLRVLAAGAGLMAATLFAAGPRLPRAAVHGAVATYVLGTSVLTASVHTAAGFMMASRAFQWLAVYAALFLPLRAARWHALAITVGCATAVGIARIPGTFAEAVIVCVTVWMATLLLGALAERLRAQADTDPLTGLLNRSGFTKAADREHALAGRTRAPLAIAALDLDGFKRLNDEHGHAAGDRVLADLAGAWSRTLRPGDLLARVGGDEFVALFPATGAEDAREALARMRCAHPADWSAGVAEWRPGETLAACLARADEDLYEAKATRRAPRAAITSVRA